jgi:hypothetical protein
MIRHPSWSRAGSACHALNCRRMSRKLLAACGACILTMNDEAAKVRRLYSGGRNSLLSQPATLSVSRGSGRSQSKHWNVCFPFPSGGSAKTRGAPPIGTCRSFSLAHSENPAAGPNFRQFKTHREFWSSTEGTSFSGTYRQSSTGSTDRNRPLALQNRPPTHNAAKLNNAGGAASGPDSAIPRWLSVCTGRAEVQRIWNVFLALGLSNHAGPPGIQAPNGLSSPPALGRFP